MGGGEVQVTIQRFSLSHELFQAADSPKYLMFSTRRFEVPPDRPATFAVDLAVENKDGDPEDYRRGMAAFHVFDLGGSKPVFAVVGTSTRVFAMHEHLGPGDNGQGAPFCHVVESPGRSQSLARQAGDHRAAVPVPGARRRRVRGESRPAAERATA